MADLIPVLVKRSVYTKIQNPTTLAKYIDDAVEMGSKADLYKNPAIATVFYDDGTAAAVAIRTAVTKYDNAPTTGNYGKIGDRMKEGVDWLNEYATKVEKIANIDSAPRDRVAASNNIMLSFLTPQKLTADDKGKPEKPMITVENTGSCKFRIEITNGDAYQPTTTNFIAIELPAEDTAPAPVVSITDKGMLNIKFAGEGEVVLQTAGGKGKVTTLTVSNPGSEYAIYAYGQNGKKQVGDLSRAIIVTA